LQKSACSVDTLAVADAVTGAAGEALAAAAAAAVGVGVSSGLLLHESNGAASSAHTHETRTVEIMTAPFGFRRRLTPFGCREPIYGGCGNVQELRALRRFLAVIAGAPADSAA